MPLASSLLVLRLTGTLFALLIGLAFGSFLNVCLCRWPLGESVSAPRSHCRNCSHVLSWWENLPLVSWLLLRGRCRGCKTSIGVRYPLVEALVATLWAAYAWPLAPAILDPFVIPSVAFYNLLILLGGWLFLWLMVALAALDLAEFWLPDWLTLPGIALGLLLTLSKSLWLDRIRQAKLLSDSSPEQLSTPHLLGQRLAAILLLSGGLWITSLIYKWIRHREGIGLGDVKLVAMLAAWLGLGNALVSFAVGIFLGALVALLVLFWPQLRREQSSWQLTQLPLGSFLCLGGVVACFWGERITSLYLQLCGLR